MNFERMLTCSVRETLGIPETMRVAESPSTYNKKTETQKRLEDLTSADCWAISRARELLERGVSAEARRIRKSQALCVVYQVAYLN